MAISNLSPQWNNVSVNLPSTSSLYSGNNAITSGISSIADAFNNQAKVQDMYEKKEVDKRTLDFLAKQRQIQDVDALKNFISQYGTSDAIEQEFGKVDFNEVAKAQQSALPNLQNRLTNEYNYNQSQLERSSKPVIDQYKLALTQAKSPEELAVIRGNIGKEAPYIQQALMEQVIGRQDKANIAGLTSKIFNGESLTPEDTVNLSNTELLSLQKAQQAFKDEQAQRSLTKKQNKSIELELEKQINAKENEPLVNEFNTLYNSAVQSNDWSAVNSFIDSVKDPNLKNTFLGKTNPVQYERNLTGLARQIHSGKDVDLTGLNDYEKLQLSNKVFELQSTNAERTIKSNELSTRLNTSEEKKQSTQLYNKLIPQITEVAQSLTFESLPSVIRDLQNEYPNNPTLVNKVKGFYENQLNLNPVDKAAYTAKVDHEALVQRLNTTAGMQEYLEKYGGKDFRERKDAGDIGVIHDKMNETNTTLAEREYILKQILSTYGGDAWFKVTDSDLEGAVEDAISSYRNSARKGTQNGNSNAPSNEQIRQIMQGGNTFKINH